MIKYYPIRPIYLAMMVGLLYLLITHWSWLTLSLGLACLFGLCCQYDKKTIGKTLIILMSFALYFSVLQEYSNRLAQTTPSQLQTIIPTPDSLTINGDLLAFRGYQGHNQYQAYYRLKSKEEQAFFQNLDELVQLQVVAEVTNPEGQRNFQGFNHQAYLKTQGIYRIAKIKDITAITPESTTNPLMVIQGLRRKLIVFIHRQFPNPMKHYMTGLLLGYLDKDFNQMSDLYSQLGIIHLFALSGMQVGFFIKHFRYLLLRLGLTQETVTCLQIPFSLLYAGLTGFTISVNRSLLQAFLAQKGIKGLDNLATTLLLLFILMPQALMTTGGVLSFAYAFLLSSLNFEQLNPLKASFYQTLSLTIGILPILTWYFAAFQPLSIGLTVLLSLLFDSLILPLLLGVWLLSPLIIIDHINPMFDLLERGISSIADWAGHGLILGMPSPAYLIITIICLGLLADKIRLQKPIRHFIVMIGLCFVLTKHPLDNEVTILDIGQGDSIFIRDMTGQTLLIDVGGRLSFPTQEPWQTKHSKANAENTLIPYLKSRGVHHINHLVLTHTDSDHIGDLEVVAKQISIGQILVSPGSLTQESFVQRLKALHVPVGVIQAGDSLSIMGSQLKVLYPNTIGDGGNDDSIVLYGRLLNQTFLFTGDLEEHGEQILMQSYPKLRVDVLKAGHHGSKYSSQSAFLDHIQPKIALISAGQQNRYQHPHHETLKRFTQRGITIYRTDQDGAIRFRGWQNWHIETVKPPQDEITRQTH